MRTPKRRFLSEVKTVSYYGSVDPLIPPPGHLCWYFTTFPSVGWGIYHTSQRSGAFVTISAYNLVYACKFDNNLETAR